MKAFLNNPFVHGVVFVICLALGYVITGGGAWQTITIGAVLKMGYQWLSNSLGPAATA